MVVLLMSVPLVAFVAAVLALVLPVRIFLRAEGGTKTPFKATVRLMVYGGLLGVGGKISDSGSRYHFVVGAREILKLKAAPRVLRPGFYKSPGKSRKLRSLRFWKKPFVVFCRCMRFDRLGVHVRLGLGDPALTGMVFGLLSAINSALPERHVITPEWDFTRSTASFDADAVLTFRSHQFWARMTRMLWATRRRGNQRLLPNAMG